MNSENEETNLIEEDYYTFLNVPKDVSNPDWFN